MVGRPWEAKRFTQRFSANGRWLLRGGRRLGKLVIVSDSTIQVKIQVAEAADYLQVNFVSTLMTVSEIVTSSPSSPSIFTLLSVKHFQSAVDFCTRLPIPINYQDTLTTVLLLRNSQFPRHFLNGCYIFLKHDATEQDVYALLSSLTPSHDHCLLKNIRSFPLFQTSVPPFVRFRVLGLPNRFKHLPGSWTSEGSTLVLSIRPSTLEQVRAGCKSYMSQLRSDAFIVDGGEYFASTYPAKKHLVDHECILAWMCTPGSTSGRIPAACIQYRFLEDDPVPHAPVSTHALVTGIAVDESFRRRGYGRALLLSVIASLPRRAELWVEVGDENEAAKGLYRSCGFVERWKQQSLCLRSVT